MDTPASPARDEIPGPGVQIRREGDHWTLIVVRDLRHAPEKVWRALTDPAHLRQWAPFDTNRPLDSIGPAQLDWAGAPQTTETVVTRADAPRLLEFNGLRWELEPRDGGTRLTLWHHIGRPYIAMGAAGWHLSLDALDRLLAGQPQGRLAGPEAMRHPDWQRLHQAYARQFEAQADG